MTDRADTDARVKALIEPFNKKGIEVEPTWSTVEMAGNVARNIRVASCSACSAQSGSCGRSWTA